MRMDRLTYDEANSRFSQFHEHAWISLRLSHKTVSVTLPIELSHLSTKYGFFFWSQGQDRKTVCHVNALTWPTMPAPLAVTLTTTRTSCCVHRVRYHRYWLSHVRMKTRSEGHFYSEHRGIRSSETWVNIYQTLRPPIPEDKIVHNCNKKPAYRTLVPYFPNYETQPWLSDGFCGKQNVCWQYELSIFKNTLCFSKCRRSQNLIFWSLTRITSRCSVNKI
jgi:hypothetical protein